MITIAPTVKKTIALQRRGGVAKRLQIENIQDTDQNNCFPHNKFLILKYALTFPFMFLIKYRRLISEWKEGEHNEN